MVIKISRGFISVFILVSCCLAYSQPSLQWANRYNGPGNLSDIGWFVRFDNLGNSIAAGTSSNQDIVIIKYSSSGSEVWNRVIPPSGTTLLAGIIVDNANNIVVSYSNNSATLSDIVTAKYSPSGDLLWNVRYNYINNGNERPGAISVDGFNDVYVCGSSQAPSGTCGLLTLKYSSSGLIQWSNYTSTSNNPVTVKDMELDQFGNVYSCGRIEQLNSNAFIAKVSPSGTSLFFQTYNNSSVSGTDYFNELAIDGINNFIYLAGSSWGGTSTTDDFITAKYSTSGILQWLQRYDGPSHALDNAGSVVIDNLGNVYSGGISHGGATNYDIAIAKYSPAGIPLGYQRYSVGSVSESFSKMIIDRTQQKIYVTGAGNDNLIILKYNTSLTNEWSISYNSPFNGVDGGQDISVDSSTVYVTGYSVGAGTNNDMLTLKYSVTSGVNAVVNEIPSGFTLHQNYPNPFNPNTVISFDIPANGNVNLEIFDAAGRLVSTPVSHFLEAGSYEFNFEASGLSSGIYFYRISTNEFADVKKMTLIK